MKREYVLQHKDRPVAELTYDFDFNAATSFKALDEKRLPLSLPPHGARGINDWIENRSIPTTRKGFRELMAKAGAASAREYLLFNLGLSLTDCYWLRPKDEPLTWGGVNLFANREWSDSLVRARGGRSTPDASLSGDQEKYWIVCGGEICLMKFGDGADGQQCVNEAFASLVHSRQGFANFVQYGLTAVRREGEPISRTACTCPLFTSENRELISAYEVYASRKKPNDTSVHEHFISACAALGMDQKEIRSQLEYQTLTDFALTNTDRHLNNFGVLRDPDTLEYIGPAPIFDTGNSMSYNLPALDDRAILKIKTPALGATEAACLKRVKDASRVDAAKLPTPEDTREFYIENGVSEERAAAITVNYKKKLKLFKDFIRTGSIQGAAGGINHRL